MNPVRAIGFDLFNTLITVAPHTLDEAMSRLTQYLRRHDIPIEETSFRKAYREAALHFLELTRRDGRETHNRFWISAALKSQGQDVPPEDRRIAAGVEAYFSAFYKDCRFVSGTLDMLQRLRDRYTLGLLSNFTHAPAAREILDRMGLTPFFAAVIISGAVGYRKPHPRIFQELIERLGEERRRILFVGDDPEADVFGAVQAGIQPVWMTYVRDHRIPVAQGMHTSDAVVTEDPVLRISTWADLLHLLEGA
jgi:putative hydrolase of the HAD superfamily